MSSGAISWGCGRSLDNQIVAGQASHGPPVDDAVLPFRIVSEEGCDEVFDGMKRIGMDGWFRIGMLHAHIEGCGIFRAKGVNARDIDSRADFRMVHLKASN